VLTLMIHKMKFSCRLLLTIIAEYVGDGVFELVGHLIGFDQFLYPIEESAHVGKRFSAYGTGVVVLDISHITC